MTWDQKEIVLPGNSKKDKVGKAGGNSGKADEHKRQVEDANKDGQHDQLAQEGASRCCRFVGKNLRAGPVDKVVVAQVKVEEG